MKKKTSLWKKILAESYIWILLLLMYLPIIFLMIFSFTNATNLGQWNGFTFDLYISLFKDKDIMTALGNTLILAVTSSLASVVLGTIGAIGVYELKKGWKKAAEFITQIPVVNPEIVIALSLVIFFVFLGNYIFKDFTFSYWTLLIGHMVLSLPFVYLSVKPKLQQMDPALYEAALDLGCTPRQAIGKVVLPEIFPGITSGFLLALTLSLDDFVVTAFTRGSGLLSGAAKIETLSTYVQSIIKRRPLPAKLRALTTIIFLAVLLLAVGVTLYKNYVAKRGKKRPRRIY